MVCCSRKLLRPGFLKGAVVRCGIAQSEGLNEFYLVGREAWISSQRVDDAGKLWFPKIELHKSRGQHLLKNTSLVQAIVRKAEVKETDTVLEIGPGTGNMTIELLKFAKKVVAVEVDSRMVKELLRRTEGTPGADRLQIIQGDFLKAELPHFDICVANIPYQISSPVVFKLLQHRPSFRFALIMFQKEFAQRLLAKPGDPLFCRLALNAQLFADVEHVLKVGKGNFQPPPKVDSSVVRIRPRSITAPIDLREWDGLTRACFSRKNKTLAAIFKQKNILTLLRRNSEQPQAVQVVGNSSIDELDKNVFEFDDLSQHATGDDDQNVDSTFPNGEDNSLLSIKETIQNVLEEGGYQNKRSAKMTEEDFIKLLSLLKTAGIHFAQSNVE